MAIEMHPKPTDVPTRPRLTAEALAQLYASGMVANTPAPEGRQWLDEIRAWAAWADGYRDRLTAWWTEHQAISHAWESTVDIRPAATTGHPRLDHCKVCAYLADQYRTAQL